MIKILVTGSNGQLGSEIKKIAKKKKDINWLFSDRKSFDLTKIDLIESFLNIVNPSIIINCAAYTNVDKAESELELANLINFKAVDSLSQWSSSNNVKLLHVSTDYVFNGKSSTPLSEEAITAPLNVYGSTKLKGEKVCLKNDPNCIIIRTSWIFSSFGNNFVKIMRNLMMNNDSLSVVNDQLGSPTYAADLAETIIKIINYKNWIPGIFHYSNEGVVSWFDFAKSIKKNYGFSTNINGISTDKYPTPAKRPKYSLLDKSKIKTTFNIKIPNYENSLYKCINILKNEK